MEIIFKEVTKCLNPCCNGIYPMSFKFLGELIDDDCLNPCCNGIYPMS